MDIQKPDNSRARKIKRGIYAGVVLLFVGGTSIAVSRWRPAGPTVDRSTIGTGEVKRGAMLRDVHGIGTLVPEDICWIPAQTDSRVDRIVQRPGALEKPDSIILELSNPSLQRDTLDAEYQLKAAIADYENLKVQLNSELLNQKAAAAAVHGDYEQAKIQREVDERLHREGIGAEVTSNHSGGKRSSWAFARSWKTSAPKTPRIRPALACWCSELPGVRPGRARTDLTVDGTIELENLRDILFVGRPADGQPETAVGLFKMVGDGSEAVRVNVKLGRASVNSVEVLQGLNAGDVVILSDMSNWDSYERIRLR